MASLPTSLHFVLFPLMTQGHMIPMVDIARLLAERGSMVTIITTPINANRFKPVTDRAIKDQLKIHILELQLPVTEVGLPEGCENFDLISSQKLFPKLFTAATMLEEPAEIMLRGLTPAPSCIISDNLFAWTNSIAQKFNIPRLVFHGPGCFTVLCMHIAMYTKILHDIVSASEYFVLPGLQDRIELTIMQACSWGGKDAKEAAAFVDGLLKAEQDANGIVVNSFQELEPYYVEELAKGSINEHDCLKWLDSREPESVIFVCLGSLARVATEQNIELGLGLESSKKPFLWCIRHSTDELERWLIEEGYEERVKDRGLIIRGWAPQVLILSHQAVGGFVTHCGWNSTLEGISAGVPMVTWPHFSDQFINERFIVDVLKIGVKIGMEVPVVVGDQDKFGVVVSKEDIERSIEDLMDKGEEGKARRKRSRELREMTKMSMEDGGSSHLNMTSMIQDVVELLNKNLAPPIQDGIV
ncbi:putative UDP-glucuronosyl/UDP-glucosyltransferase, UDP-glycosyltransferase family [Helianthus annuus]|nr:putative UDP-glucuronosyl/UDP-glucosyltransferase, UDP-glycosyltransferase family [Helianthus annuus]